VSRARRDRITRVYFHAMRRMLATPGPAPARRAELKALASRLAGCLADADQLSLFGGAW